MKHPRLLPQDRLFPTGLQITWYARLRQLQQLPMAGGFRASFKARRAGTLSAMRNLELDE